MNGDKGEGYGRILNPCCLIPEGQYEVAYLYYETAVYWRQPKVVVHFSIINHDKLAGSEIDRFYTVSELDGPPKRYGNFTVRSHNCSLVREISRLGLNIPRSDRISFLSLKDKRILAEIVPVLSDYRGHSLNEDEQYSRIARLLGVVCMPSAPMEQI